MYITMAFYEKFWNKLVKNLALTEWGEVRLDLEILKGNRGNRELYVDYSDPLIRERGGESLRARIFFYPERGKEIWRGFL